MSDITTAPVPAPATLPPGVVEIGGQKYLQDSSANLVRVELVKTEDLIEDEMVRKIMGFAVDLNAQLARFLAHTMDDIGGFVALLDQEYGVTRRGKKGNASYTTYDGLMMIRVQRADVIDFGPQLQTAKALIDEYLNEISAEASAEIQTIITRAFNTDKEGEVNRSELFRLRRLSITDPRWVRAMEAVTDATRVIGSKEYVRFYRRETQDGQWTAVTIDLASAGGKA